MKIFRIRHDPDVTKEFGYFTPNNYTKIVGWCESPSCPWRSIIDRTYPATMMYAGGAFGDFYMGVGLWIATKSPAERIADFSRSVQICDVVTSGPVRGEAVKYKGPPIVELVPKLEISWNPELSTLKLRDHCSHCGRASYDILGIEELPHEEKFGERWEMVPRRPRKPDMGVILRASDLQGHDFFDYGSNFHMCTEAAKDFVESQGWSNIAFLECGEVIAD